ncbi:MAG: hypothetical protein HYY30_06405 [Chloroflexi bacterium]|nr:hypothetical protein [Chloroflexota bacterium]
MLKRYRGGTFVGEGTYLNIREGEFIGVPKEGNYLGENKAQTFVKVPLALALLLGPFFGLLFILFLPMAVPLVVAMLLIQRFKRRMPELRDSVLKATTHSQRPGLSYLHTKGASGKERQTNDAKQRPREMLSGNLDDVIAKLEEDVARRRETEDN